MAIWYVDYQGGNDASSGTSFANRKKTIQGLTASDLAPGDTIRVMESRNRGSLNTTALWTNLNCYVYLTSSLNALVDDGETAWTASTDVVCTADSTIYGANSKSSKIDIATGFTTGLAAYSALGSTQDYSTYQGLTFWLRVNASLAANTLSLRLCSDTAGVTTVDTFPIPRCNVTNMWVPIYVDKGSALGSSIQSVALYADADPAAMYDCLAAGTKFAIDLERLPSGAVVLRQSGQVIMVPAESVYTAAKIFGSWVEGLPCPSDSAGPPSS